VPQSSQLAQQKLVTVAEGRDPAEEAKREHEALTIAGLCDHYYEQAKAGNILSRGKVKKSSRLAIGYGRIERHTKPLLGQMAVADLTRRDAEKFMQDIRDGATAASIKTGKYGRSRVRGGAGTAKKALSLLSAIYNYALRQELVEDNPCRYVARPVDNKRQRFLTPEEYGRPGLAVKEAKQNGENQYILAAIEVLLFTGCRKGEVLNLRRHEVDIAKYCLRFGATKSGEQVRPCGQSAMKILSHLLESHDSDWVFPAYRIDGTITDVRKPLIKLCKTASLKEVTLHVFRHSFATVAHELGYSQLTIAGLLGHRLSSVTSQYIHHVDHALLKAADRVSQIVQSRLYRYGQ